MTGLLDTNVALYLLGGRILAPLPIGSYGVSVITEMELLAWPSLTEQEEKKVREFLKAVAICELTASIRGRAVELRKRQHLKLPDAVVCVLRRWNSKWNFGPMMLGSLEFRGCAAAP